MIKEFEYKNYNSGNIRDAINEAKNVILPIGAIEAHSDHLPLDTDNILSSYYSLELAKRTESLVLPNFDYGPVWSLSEAPGTLNIDQDNLVNCLVDIIKSLDKNGAKMVTLITAHFGNLDACKIAARRMFGISNIKVIYLSYPNIKKYLNEFAVINDHGLYLHACEVETSLMLAVDDSKVDMTKSQKGTINIPKETNYKPFKWTEFSENYIMGDSRLATKEKGLSLFSKVIKDAVEIIMKEKSEL